jgi:AcrR family transcriptional regulator
MSSTASVAAVGECTLSPLKAARQSRLLQVAEAVFLREGYHATSMERIAAEAGVVKQTLYNYFPDKDALLATLVAGWKSKGGDLLGDLAAALAHLGDRERYPDPVAALRDALLVTFQVADNVDSVAILRLLLEVKQAAPTLSESLRAALHPHTHERLIAALEQGIAVGYLRDVDVPATATLIHNTISAYRMLRPTMLIDAGAAVPAERLAAAYAEMLVRTLLQPV